MGVAVLLAWLFPDPGADGGILYPQILNKVGVALIFFLHGMALPFAALKAGTLRWPMHLVVQSCTFMLFPLAGLALLWSVGDWFTEDLQLGFFFLCALPSTVSSSIAMTAAARGNVPAAVFNATLSSVLGVVLTPFWLSAVMRAGGETLPLGPVILDLLVWLVLPLVIGQLTRPLLGVWASRNKKQINVVDKLTILLLVYTSFCNSVKAGVWTEHGLSPLVITLVGSLVIFWIVFAAVSLICEVLRFDAADRVAVIFCGSKKTLASGVPMAQLIFGSHPGLSMILLPIMVYHQLQLFICGILAGRWGREQLRQEEASAASLEAAEALST